MPVQPPLLPRVVVKFRDTVTLPYEDNNGSAIDAADVGSWSLLEFQFPGISIRTLTRSANGAALNALIERARRLDPTYQPRNLLAYFVIECPSTVEPELVVQQIRTWPSVEAAYVAEMPSSPQLPPCGLGYEDEPDIALPQGGINAVYARTVNGGDGTGVQFFDLERGWKPDHEAIARFGIGTAANPLLWGEIDGSDRGHGTSVLGIVAGRAPVGSLNPTFVGIAPGVASVRVVSYKPVALPVDETMIPDCILTVVNNNNLQFGDVFLLEVQSSTFLPIETRLQCYDYIRLGTALGVVIVEPSGNAGGPLGDLDAYVDQMTGLRTLFRDPGNLDFKDSGAIMVAAGSMTRQAGVVAGAIVQHFGCVGKRIDCWAWGDGFAQSSDSQGPSETTSYGCFGGTSCAAAIIAGAALSVQGMLQASQSRRFSPKQLRAILSDPGYGTPAVGPDNDKVGIMPNLKTIENRILNVSSDLYMRDFVGDAGQSNGGAYSTSPDIIVLPSPVVMNPQVSFGPGSGTEDDDALSSPVTPGVDHYIYVRLRNRGGSDAPNVNVDLFFAPPASLVVPTDWTKIGSTTVTNVPSGDVLTVSDGILWSAGAIPGAGHYCFVAIAGNATDAPPGLADFQTWDRFERFIGANNNVAWRNFNVVSPDARSDARFDAVELNLAVTGAPDQRRVMELEVVARLPRGGLIYFEAPLSAIGEWGLQAPHVEVNGEKGLIRANAHGAFTVDSCDLAAGSHVPVSLLVHVPEPFRNQAYTVYARQLWRGREVGRVTWRLQRPRPRSMRDRIRTMMSWFSPRHD